MVTIPVLKVILFNLHTRELIYISTHTAFNVCLIYGCLTVAHIISTSIGKYIMFSIFLENFENAVYVNVKRKEIILKYFKTYFELGTK